MTDGSSTGMQEKPKVQAGLEVAFGVASQQRLDVDRATIVYWSLPTSWEFSRSELPGTFVPNCLFWVSGAVERL